MLFLNNGSFAAVCVGLSLLASEVAGRETKRGNFLRNTAPPSDNVASIVHRERKLSYKAGLSAVSAFTSTCVPDTKSKNKDGSKKMKNGSNKMKNGSNVMIDGSNVMIDGSKKMKNGSNKMKDGSKVKAGRRVQSTGETGRISKGQREMMMDGSKMKDGRHRQKTDKSAKISEVQSSSEYAFNLAFKDGCTVEGFSTTAVTTVTDTCGNTFNIRVDCLETYNANGTPTMEVHKDVERIFIKKLSTCVETGEQCGNPPSVKVDPFDPTPPATEVTNPHAPVEETPDGPVEPVVLPNPPAAVVESASPSAAPSSSPAAPSATPSVSVVPSATPSVSVAPSLNPNTAYVTGTIVYRPPTGATYNNP
jgi:uncharacterized Zn ribbon protein